MTHPFMDGIQSAFMIKYIYGTHFVIFHHPLIIIHLYIHLFEDGTYSSLDLDTG